MNTTSNPPNAAERPSAAQIIAAELARIDGYDPDDQHGGLYDLRWSGGPNPEPEGDAWSMDYLPKAERIAAAIDSHHPAESVSAEPVAYERRWRYVSGSWSVWCRCDQAAFDAKEVMRDCGVEQPTEYRALYLHPQPSTPGAVSDEDVKQWGYALERAIESQRLLAEGIDKDNPEDPWASLLVHEDVAQLGNLATALESFAKRSAAPPAQAVSVGVPESVRYAVERMSIDPTWLKGVTAQEDARCMLIIADFISSLSAAPAAATREGKE